MAKTENPQKDRTKEKRRKRLSGIVLSNKMEKTVIVEVSTKSAHPVYKKVVETSKNYAAHTNDKLEIGDEVMIEECKPISKTKTWKVIKKVNRHGSKRN